MQKYSVTNEAGLITTDEATHAHGDVVELDETLPQTQEWVAAGTITAVVEDAPAPVTDEPAPEPTPVGQFTIEVAFVDGASQEDIDAAGSFVADLNTEVNSNEATVPAVISTVTIRRA